MATPEEITRLASRLRALEARVGDSTSADKYERHRAIVGDAVRIEEQPLAAAAKKKLLDGAQVFPTAAEFDALVRALAMWRPVTSVRDGEALGLPAHLASAFPDWDAFRTRIQPLIRSVGRLQRMKDTKAWAEVGTGFVVAKNRLLTNKHVWNDPKGSPSHVTFFGEEGTSGESRAVRSVKVATHPDVDLALLEFDGESPPSFGFSATQVADGSDIAVIGFPMADPRSKTAQVEIFGVFDTVGTKRLAPGQVLETKNRTVFHDASTLGGNSGSPAVLQTTGEVVGVHGAGKQMRANEAQNVGIVQEFLK